MTPLNLRGGTAVVARLPHLAALLACLLLASSCVTLPEDGPVVSVEPSDPQQTGKAGVDFQPAPPREGAEPDEIVASYLESMAAAPLSLSSSAARAYLTEDAARSWQPASTIVYSDSDISSGTGAVEAELTDAVRIDERGTWRGALTPSERTISFSVVLEDGEWRIDNPPWALIVTRRFFDTRFDRATVHWFDPSGQVMVPEPVYVPGGESMPASLVERLLLGPPEELRGVVRTFLPPGLETPGVSVDGEGLADVRLSEVFPQMTEEDLDRAFAQLAWTLRDVPAIESLRITDPDGPVTLPGGRADAWVGEGAEFDASGSAGSDNLFALIDGVLASNTGAGFEPVSGSVGEDDTGWRSFTVAPDGRQAIGVSGSGGTAFLAPVGSTEGGPVPIASDAASLLKPAWDSIDGPWLVDVTDADGAVVRLASGNKVRDITVPGVTGRKVVAFEVSRDGSRFVAILRGARRDRLVVARVVRNDKGRVTRVQPASAVSVGAEAPRRMRDLAWRSPTSVRVLAPPSGEVSQVSEVSLDGSAEAVNAPLATVRGRMVALVGSPRETAPAYAVDSDEVVGLNGASVPRLPQGIERLTLTYPG